MKKEKLKFNLEKYEFNEDSSNSLLESLNESTANFLLLHTFIREKYIKHGGIKNNEKREIAN